MLLLPVSWELVHSIRTGEPFAPLDLVKDFLSPFSREKKLQKQSSEIQSDLQALVAEIETENGERSDSFTEMLSDLETKVQDFKRTLLEVNSLLPLDSTEESVQKISVFERLLGEWESEESVRDSLFKMAQDLQKNYAGISWNRIFDSWIHHGLFSGKYLRAYENRLEKENTFVKKTRPIYQTFSWKVLHDPGEKAVLADSNFLFYRQDVDFLVKPAPWKMDSLENPIEAVLDFRNELAKRGVELLVVVVPGKPSIYPEILNPILYGLSGLNISLGRRFVDTLQTLNVNVVNLYPVLQAAKQKDRAGDFLYLNTDTHWTPRGAKIAAKAIAEKVRKMPIANELPHENFTDSLVSADRTGDVATMADLEYAFPVQTVEAYQIKNAKGPRQNDFRKSKILILGDSYSRIYETDAPMSAGWISQFASELQTPVAAIVSDGGASTLVREKLARKSGVLKGKKLVVWEFVERDLRFGAEGWKKVRLE